MDFKKASDEELEQITIEGAYTHGPRKVETALLEIARRRSDRLYVQQKKSAELLETTFLHLKKVSEIQEKISQTTQLQLNRIIKSLINHFG